ncbi:MAG: CCA tRNA nucleotidyltransferase [archaeon]
MNLKLIEKKVLERIKPKEESLKEVDIIIKKINSLLKESSIQAECMAAGSYAKGTILKDDFDVDLFVRFNYDYKDRDISEMLFKAIASLKPERIHGSRDYYHLKKKSIMFEIIPVLRIDDYRKAANVTDMSPLHVSYVRKHFDSKPGLTDEVRLAKQFCKSAKVYGAESYIRGFSGHVLDLLIINYGSFESLLMQAAVWGERVIIDLEKHLKDPVQQLNKAKVASPLIIVDPIQPDRNAAAALSKEAFEEFKSKAKEFLENPSERSFEVRKLDLAKVKKSAGKERLLVLEAVPTDDSDDVAGTKLLKCHEKIQSELERNEFKLLEAGWEFSPKKSTLYYIIKKEELSANIIMQGPPIKAKPNAKMFLEKHRKTFEKDKRLYAEERRKYMAPEALMKELIKSGYISERVKKIKIANV